MPAATTHRPRHAEKDRPQRYAIRTEGLRKTYRRGRTVAVAGLDLKVPAGGVHGFLGPNGSGKTTTIRMLLGLIRADAGDMQVFDVDVPHGLPEIIDRIGSIVEQPKFFPQFSGKKNLRILAQGIGAPPHRVGEVLEEVGLAERGRDSFRTYSLGMKQRLAIAGAMLKDPDLLIFDEPTNGLDPAGIHEIRQLMRGLADQGKSVLVSSHILAEVQQIADTVSIIGRGNLLAEGDVDTILAGAGEAVRVGVRDEQAASTILVDHGYAVTRAADRTLTVTRADGPLDPADIAQALGEQGHWVHELTPQRAGLEQVFLELTATEHLGAQSSAHRPAGGPS